MTKITDYLWSLPHEPESDDPPEVAMLQEAFRDPVVATLQGPLEAMGYELEGSDVVIKLDERVDYTYDTYYANVRFLRYLLPDVITRVHLQHAEWGLLLPEAETHLFFINLDRFKVLGPTQHLVPAWPGRLHTRMSALPGDVFEHDGPDQIWQYASTEELAQLLDLFLDKFERLGRPWLENLSDVD